MRSVAPACVAVVVAGLARAAAAAPCPPSATLVGDAPLVAEIGALLGDRGVAVEPPGCPTIQVAVTGRSDQLTLALEHDGRRIERVVGDAATAATVIESFVRVGASAHHCAGRGELGVRASVGPTVVFERRDRNQGARAGLEGDALATSAVAVVPAVDLEVVIGVAVMDAWGLRIAAGPSLARVSGAAEVSWLATLGVSWAP